MVFVVSGCLMCRIAQYFVSQATPFCTTLQIVVTTKTSSKKGCPQLCNKCSAGQDKHRTWRKHVLDNSFSTYWTALTGSSLFLPHKVKSFSWSPFCVVIRSVNHWSTRDYCFKSLCIWACSNMVICIFRLFGYVRTYMIFLYIWLWIPLFWFDRCMKNEYWLLTINCQSF